MNYDTIFIFLLVGIGGTVALDIWAWIIFKIFGLPATNWTLVGRWVGHMKSKQFIQPNLASTKKVRGELIIGWVVHYIIGMAYGLIILLLWGEQWLDNPTVLAPMLVSWFFLIAPFFIMMPGMGLGIAGAKTPNPILTRIRSFAGHTAFGLGMYATALYF